MEKKSQIIGVICIVCAFILLFKTGPSEAISLKEPKITISKAATFGKNFSQKVTKNFTSTQKDSKKIILENDVIRVEFATVYGAINSVHLKKYRRLQDRDNLVVFNEGECYPALGMFVYDQNSENRSCFSEFSLKYFDSSKVVFSKFDGDGIETVREYGINLADDAQHDAYIIKHSTRIVNGSQSPLKIKKFSLNIGNVPATAGDPTGDYLNFGHFDGKSVSFIKSRDFSASNGFFGLGKRDQKDYIRKKKNIVWGSVKNQFFTAILTPSVRANGFLTFPVLVNDSVLDRQDEGISAEMLFKVGIIPPNDGYSLDLDFYVGPKDFVRLDRMSNRQDLVMQFGFFGIVSKFLLFIMLGIHSIVPNWGLSIILLTVVVKLCLWPLTTAQVRTTKKMSIIQEPLRLIKEKYKNNPAKIQAETMKLFRHYRINPAAAFFPVLIQIPIFLGLYYMLRTSSDLRFAHFLWIKDLSIADTICYIARIPVNILPLIMGGTMALQMGMAKMPSVDGSQSLMLKLMPLIFLFFCYSFPSGLVLYWTAQNILTMIQQYVVSKRRDMQADQLLAVDNLDPERSKSGRGRKKFNK